MPQQCENSDQMIHSEHDYHFSVGLFGAKHILMTSFWRRLQKNDTVEVASEKEGFILQFGADKNPLTMVEVSACCSNVCIQNFVRLFELTVSTNGKGLAVGR